MKYTAPAVLNTVNATEFIRGSKTGKTNDSNLEPSNGAGYGSDE
jgi:hypothetical protein